MGESALTLPATKMVVSILMMFASSPALSTTNGLPRQNLHQRAPAATTATTAAFFIPRPTPTRRLDVGGVSCGGATFGRRSRCVLPRRDDAYRDAFTTPAGSKVFVVPPPTWVRDDCVFGGNRHPRHRLLRRGTTSAPTSVTLSSSPSSSADDTPSGGGGEAAGAGAGARVAEVEDEDDDGHPTTPPSPSDMRVKEIQSELRSRGVSYTDCFDRDSLVARLVEAREGGGAKVEQSPASTSTSTSSSKDADADHSPKKEGQRGGGGDDATAEAATTSPKKKSSSDDQQHSSSFFDRDAVASELRTLRVSELRKRLGERNVRWSNMIEKEDLVRALVDSMELSSQFSVSGELTPGEANDITESVLAEELGGECGGVPPPLLLDVYATWCGPCQLMTPQIKAAACELGTKVRVCKMDSDRFPEWSGRLEVGGLPTTILFDSDGNEVGRQEGALMKDQILEFVRPYL